MDPDPPRRPSDLFRHKSWHPPPSRRRRTREVLEDITWIVNEDRNGNGNGGQQWRQLSDEPGILELEVSARNTIQNIQRDEQGRRMRNSTYEGPIPLRLNVNNNRHIPEDSENRRERTIIPLPALRLPLPDRAISSTLPASSSPASSPVRSQFTGSALLGVPSGPFIAAAPLARSRSAGSVLPYSILSTSEASTSRVRGECRRASTSSTSSSIQSMRGPAMLRRTPSSSSLGSVAGDESMASVPSASSEVAHERRPSRGTSLPLDGSNDEQIRLRGKRLRSPEEEDDPQVKEEGE